MYVGGQFTFVAAQTESRQTHSLADSRSNGQRWCGVILSTSKLPTVKLSTSKL
jgi:hypothetical protein